MPAIPEGSEQTRACREYRPHYHQVRLGSQGQ